MNRRQLGAWARSLLSAVPLLLGATLLAFYLIAQFGPDTRFAQVGRGADAAGLEALARQLDEHRPWLLRYVDTLAGWFRLDFGHAAISGEPVAALLARTLPVSLLALMPGFVLGQLLALGLALAGAWRIGRWPDRLVGALSATSMSLSLIVVLIALQSLFGVWLDWLPVRGWSAAGPVDYLRHVTLPTLVIVVTSLGYQLRFFRTLFVEALSDPPVRTARAYGLPPRRILLGYVLRTALLPISTRILYALPVLLLGGSLVLENHFGIPGVGQVAYEALLAGDEQVLMALVGGGSVLLILLHALSGGLLRALDPRLARPSR
ncbi:ABC transporter permease [Wenzhouxiangella marina]|uniref:Peptide/nickel transporter permease protein n=1 Tax=Wenzhouxiangella marina TaxID=1579979 RepID=A0A0K0XZN1_9GAMM|nr:ABC transporter permease [Wenzhouxiangella marina]AKS43097.1 Peptide/nickel transporter permease protein [Wenzhouxiangella marina]MBB6087218.1 peptide/nickel transport system permease protein [Wenzhouxiangella marina]